MYSSSECCDYRRVQPRIYATPAAARRMVKVPWCILGAAVHEEGGLVGNRNLGAPLPHGEAPFVRLGLVSTGNDGGPARGRHPLTTWWRETPFVARQTCVLEAMKCIPIQPRGTCSSDAQCRPRRHDPSALLRCVGAVPHLDLPGRCAVEVPPSPWNNTCEYARGASRGHPVLPTGAPCLQLAALQQTSRSSHGGNTIAVVVAGMAEGLAPLHVHASMRTCLIDALSSHVQVFANLQARTSSNM